MSKLYFEKMQEIMISYADIKLHRIFQSGIRKQFRLTQLLPDESMTGVSAMKTLCIWIPAGTLVLRTKLRNLRKIT